MFSDNKGSDQPAHLRSLIRNFIIRLLEILLNLNLLQANFLACHCCRGDWFESPFFETSKTGFVAIRPIFKIYKEEHLPSFTEYYMFTNRHQLLIGH